MLDHSEEKHGFNKKGGFPSITSDQLPKKKGGGGQSNKEEGNSFKR